MWDKLLKEADKLGSSYYIAMPDHNGIVVNFLSNGKLQSSHILNPDLKAYLEELNSKYGLSGLVGKIHSVDEDLFEFESAGEISPLIRLTITDYESSLPFCFRMDYVKQTTDGITNPKDRKFIKAVETYVMTHPSQASNIYERLLQSRPKLRGLIITHENANKAVLKN